MQPSLSLSGGNKLWFPAVRSTSLCIQHEPESSVGSHAVEDILPGPCTKKKNTSYWLQGLQASYTDIPHHVDSPLWFPESPTTWLAGHNMCAYNTVSDRAVSSTGASEGTVLSPFLFNLYNTDVSYCSKSCHLQKYPDNFAIVECIVKKDKEEYRDAVGNFAPVSLSIHPGAPSEGPGGVQIVESGDRQ